MVVAIRGNEQLSSFARNMTTFESSLAMGCAALKAQKSTADRTKVHTGTRRFICRGPGAEPTTYEFSSLHTCHSIWAVISLAIRAVSSGTVRACSVYCREKACTCVP